jgi:ParB family transcriptional regulator, chromosome partitioning protein
VSKRGLPTSVKMKHDAHYVEELVRSTRSIGRLIPIEKIHPNPDQPRVEFGDLSELTASIKEQGVLEPLLVKPSKDDGTYMIIAGERRWRASTIAGLRELPCIELDIDEQTIAEIALVENLQRKDLTVWEIADGLADLSDRYGYTHEEIARKIGKSRTTVTESMAIAGLPKDIRERCRKAEINSKTTLVEISRQFDGPAMHEFLDRLESDRTGRKSTAKKRPSKNEKPDTDAALQTSAEKRETDPGVSEKPLFRFSSEKSGFELQISFDSGDFTNLDVLKALKEAFDTIKSR